MTCPRSYFPIKPSCLFCLFLLSLVFGCSSDESFTPSPSILISGNQYSGFLESRTSAATLPAGSRLSLFSTGGMEADNVLMTYNGTFWKESCPTSGMKMEMQPSLPFIHLISTRILNFFMTEKGSCKISCTTGKVAGKVTGPA